MKLSKNQKHDLRSVTHKTSGKTKRAHSRLEKTIMF